ncbi:hypothetical protein NLG97_g6351 [Lecanicillium saksenae]|uniref:Uncharacterized protein n=1 Tax=Lecanicillium saksenae TaxID=468837 RepID=A0ACC1QPW1_9HYPO|nr:hypothetical protein NLG97_g6351 [Lecanicillium saksenae]
MCGGDGKYTYVLLDKNKVIAGSSGSSGSSDSSAASQQPPPPPPPSASPSGTEQPPPPQIVTVTQPNSEDATTIIRTVQPSTSVQTISVNNGPATLRTITITGTAVTSTAVASNTGPTTAAPKPNGGDSGLKRGAIAGIAIGGSAAGLFMGLAALMVWRRNRQNKADKEAGTGNMEARFGGSDSVTYFGSSSMTIRRDNTSASADSRMGAFGQNKNLWRNSTGSLEDSSSETNQVLRVVNPDAPEKL